MVKELITYQTTKIKDALKQLDQSAQGVLLLVDEDNRFIRTLTDGDLRRELLSSEDMSKTLSCLPAHKSLYLNYYPDNNMALELLDAREIDHLPIVDNEGNPTALVTRKNLSKKVLLSVPHLGSDETVFVEQAFKSNWIAPLGPNVDMFEAELADYLGVKAAAALSSGTAAIHLALRVLDVGPGDKVFCSSFTFIASVNPILYQGATPVLIDSDPETWNMSPKALKRAFEQAEKDNALPKAVIVVNLYGQSADFDEIKPICDHYGVAIIEDAAESLGAKYQQKYSGTIGLLGVFSFNGNKIITTSGGGMLVSDDDALIDKARHLSTQAKENYPYYLHQTLGYNYRMSNVLAGIGRGQLKVLNERVKARRAVFERYMSGLNDLEVFQWMPEAAECYSTRWLTAATISDHASGVDPASLITALSDYGVEARRAWNPMHRQPVLQHCSYYGHEENDSVSDALFERGVCLPSASNMTLAEQEHVISAIRAITKR